MSLGRKALLALAGLIALVTVVGPIAASYFITDGRRTVAMDRAHEERERQTEMLKAICLATKAECGS